MNEFAEPLDDVTDDERREAEALAQALEGGSLNTGNGPLADAASDEALEAAALLCYPRDADLGLPRQEALLGELLNRGASTGSQGRFRRGVPVVTGTVVGLAAAAALAFVLIRPSPGGLVSSAEQVEPYAISPRSAEASSASEKFQGAASNRVTAPLEEARGASAGFDALQAATPAQQPSIQNLAPLVSDRAVREVRRPRRTLLLETPAWKRPLLAAQSDVLAGGKLGRVEVAMRPLRQLWLAELRRVSLEPKTPGRGGAL